MTNAAASNVIGGMPGISHVENGIVVPGGKGIPTTVVDANGSQVIDAAICRLGTLQPAIYVDPQDLGTIARLQGRWLFAGDYWGHFGHFLFESLSRLWALPLIKEPLDGLIFYAPRGREGGPIIPDGYQKLLLELVGAGLPCVLIAAPTQVDNLIVPRQGCGLGPLSSGTPEFREFIGSRFRATAPRAGAERVYVSRSGYHLRRGGIFAEHVIEELLKAEGYVSFSPESASLEEQIATYLGAKKVIGPDSTALHVLGFVGAPDQDVAIILRRVDGAQDMMPQLAGFTGRRPAVVDRITGFLTRGNARNRSWASFAELDLVGVAKDLAETGFIDRPGAWPSMTPRRRRRTLGYYERLLACQFAEHPRVAEPEPKQEMIAAAPQASDKPTPAAPPKRSATKSVPTGRASKTAKAAPESKSVKSHGQSTP